jgi:hypothetical protein
VYSDTGDYEKAKEYYLKPLEIQKAAMGNPIDAIWAVTYVQALPNGHNQTPLTVTYKKNLNLLNPSPKPIFSISINKCSSPSDTQVPPQISTAGSIIN